MHQVNAVTIEEAKSRLESIRRTLAEINTVGRKGWGKRTRYSKQKAVLTLTYDELAGALKGKLDLKMIRKAIADYGRLKSDFRGMLYKHMRAYDAGEITISQLTSRLKKEIAGHWDEAYVLGTRAVGNPFGLSPEDSAFLKGARTTEYGFLGKFMTAIDTGKEKMARYDRLEMYVQSLDGMYGHGQVDGMPENIEIDWVLHPAEHCSDCLKFAAEGPYTKKTLPAVPRDGTTQCLSGCKCTLRFRKVPLKEPLRPVVVGPKKLRIPPGYRLPEPEEMDVAYSYHNEIVRYRQLIKITKDPKLKREYIRLRRDANKDLIDYLQKKKIYWTPGIELNLRLAGTRESIKEEVKLVLLEGGAGSGHWGHAGRKGMRGGSKAGGGASMSVGYHVAKIEGDLEKFRNAKTVRDRKGVGMEVRLMMGPKRVDDRPRGTNMSATVVKGSRQGKCYEIAGRFVMSNTGWTYVESVIHPNLGPFMDKAYHHAYAEKGDVVYDGVLNGFFSKKSYRIAYLPKKEMRYSSAQLATELLKAKKWGIMKNAKGTVGNA